MTQCAKALATMSDGLSLILWIQFLESENRCHQAALCTLCV